MTLAEALQNVELELGRTYQVHVRDKLIQVRVVSREELPLAKPIDEDDLIAESSFAFNPPTPAATILRPTSLIQTYDRPYVITDDDLKAGDLD